MNKVGPDVVLRQADPVTIGVVRELLISIVREMRVNLSRNAFSSIITEGHDYSDVLTLYTIGAQMVKLPMYSLKRRIIILLGVLSGSCLFGTRFILSALILATATVVPSYSRAEYPERPIRLVYPWPGGSPTDAIARIFADRLSKKLNTNVVVDNRGGANAILGTQLVARSAPDGYTLFITTSEPLTINPNIYKKLPYDVEKDLEPLALVAKTYFVIVATASFPANDIQNLIALAKQKPGKIAVGGYGIADMFLASFESVTGTEFLRVPFQGGAPAITATIGGEVALTFVAASAAAQYPGRLKTLGVGSAKRLASLPGVPTFVEQGLPGYEIGNWLGILAPRGIPGRARELLRQAIEQVARSSEFTDRVSAMGAEANYMPADALRAYIRAESTRWGKIVREKKIELR